MVKEVQEEKVVSLLKFLIKFNLLAIPMYMILILDIDFIPLQETFTLLLQKTFSFFGYRVERFGILLYFENLIVDISRDCIGWKSAYTMLALILATPHSTLKGKVKFYVKVLPLLILLNFFRVIVSILIGLNVSVGAMRIFHSTFQFVILGIVLLVWYRWLKVSTPN